MRSKGCSAPASPSFVASRRQILVTPVKDSASTLRRMARARRGTPPRSNTAEARAARQRLEPERAGAGEQVEHAGPLEVECAPAVLQHVEQSLPHAVGGWARGEPLRCIERGAAELAGYDAHRALISRRVACRSSLPRVQAELGGELGAQLIDRAPSASPRSTTPSAISPSANGPKETRISRFTARPRCSASRFTSRFLPSRSASVSHRLLPCSRSIRASTGP